ncbi:MAG: DEAD/DEAH box helicase family protein [Bacteroidales bacterium]
MNTNFRFLETEWQEFFRSAIKAESMCLSEPQVSALFSRITVEKAIHWMFENDPDLEMPFDTSLANLMNNWSFGNRLPGHIRDSLHLVRKIGNLAAHGQEISKKQSEQSLLILYDFLSFFAGAYGKTEFKKSRFNSTYISEILPTSDQLSKDKNLLKSQIEELTQREKELSSLRVKIDELKKENEVLSEQIRSRRKTATETGPVSYNEEETRILLIDLTIAEAGWMIHNNTGYKSQCVREFPVTGMPNETGDGYVDYVLWGENGLPLAVIEAKKTIHSPEKGKHQAELYADCLEKLTGQRPVIFYTNGFETRIWDDTFYPPRKIYGFYSREELQLAVNRRSERLDIRTIPVNRSISERYYQIEAIRRVTEHFCTDRKPSGIIGSYRKALLVMATGSGKTRNVIALVDILVKAGWVSKVLFLADRNALVKQAKDAFNEYLPSLSTVNLTKNKEEKNNRVVLSTYPTILNLIDTARNEEGWFYTPGHFDLIIIDEAHRSVYQKYRAIFDYFDSMLIGLTATPKDEVDRDTYKLFELPKYDPTYYYELEQAVKDKFLVPPVGMSVPLKFVREGIKYHDLAEDEKSDYEELFYNEETGYMPEEITASSLNAWLFNADTVRKVIAHLLKHGLKVEGGDKLGKTIIFAKNHKHAKFIQKLFYKEFPEYGGAYLDVIDNYADYSQDLIDKFKDRKKFPQVAVSVDMLDTGIDVPEIVNLVFFKPVRSYSKFWQMIGRGTRLCPGLFGEGNDKKNFYIFDLCENFEFFETTINKKESGITESISQRIFTRRLRMLQAIANMNHADYEKYSGFREALLNLTQIEICRIDNESFIVKPYMKQLLTYRTREKLNNLNSPDIEEIDQTLVQLLPPVEGDEAARRFDLLMVNLMHAKISKFPSELGLIDDLITIANELLKKRNIRDIALKESIIRPLAERDYVKTLDLLSLENLRIELRDLAVYAEGKMGNVYYSDFEDYLNEEEVGFKDLIKPYEDMEAYKFRVEHFLKEHLSHLTISKLRTNKPLTSDELNELERLIFEQGTLGTKEKFQKAFGVDHPISFFVRKIVGLDSFAAKQEFSELLSAVPISATQIKFINKLIDHLTVNGVIEKAMLVQPPFTDINDKGVFDVFTDDQVGKIVSIIDRINNNAERVMAG